MRCLRAGSRRRFKLTAGFLLLSALAFQPGARAGETRPYTVAVQVVYGQPAGPEALREEVEFSLIHGVATARCFDQVTHFKGGGRPDGELLLKVYLDEFREKTEHFASQAATQDPDAHPDLKNAISIAFEVQVHFELLTVERPARVRSRQYRQDEWYRPRSFEDPRQAARRLLIEGVTEKGRAFACKGSSKKLAKEISAAKPLE